MRRKELQRKMQAVAMAAVVTLTTVGAPATAFAEDLTMEATAADFSDDGEAVPQSTAGDDFSDGGAAAAQSSTTEAGTVEDVPDVLAGESSEGSTEGAIEDEKAAAQAYLKENFIDGTNKIITTGGDGVVKSDDGLTYTVGLTTPSGSSIRSLRLQYANTVYTTAWYLGKNNPYVAYKAPATNTSHAVKRPSAEEGPYSFTATLKLFAKGTDTTAINDDTATPLATQDFTIIIAADKKNYTVNVKPVDAKTGAAIEGATVDIQKGFNSLTPASDGSYSLVEDQEYTLAVTAEGYDKYTQTFKPAASGDMEVKMSPVIYRNTKFTVTGSDGAEITDAAITVKQGWYTTLKPQDDGSYKLQTGKDYTYTITKDGYKDVTETITVPDEGGDYAVAVTMESYQAAVDAVKKEFDKEFGALRPVYGTDTNIANVVLAKIRKYNLGVDISNVKVTLDTTEDANYIDTDGTVHYVQGELGSTSVYSKSLDCTFKFTYGTASAVSETRRVTVGWDQEYFRTKMQAEADQLTWDSIKGNNASQEEVSSDLTLPGCMGSSMQKVWSTVTWESSDTDVISIQNPTIDSPIYPRTGKITPKTDDTVVTLTATFKANDTLLNSYAGEKADNFGTITKTFTVTVKGTGISTPTEEELKAILDKYYTAERLQDCTTKEQLDTSNCTGDIQLPRYTRIKDENGEYVFNNKEITVTTSDAKLFTVNGYRVAVDMFAYEEDTTANLIVTFTREGVTAVKEIPVTVSVKGINEELDKELAIMDYAKAHYFDGIKGENTDADNITTNMRAFQEVYLDENGKGVWVYNADDKTGKGIAPDNYFEDSWQMEAAGYNHFKSSNNAIVQHENLVVARPESNTQITISTLLSSERFGQFAKNHPNNTKLQKLYKEEASATVTVKGTKAEGEALKAKIEEANKLLGTITEGTKPGQYPEGTKKALEEAIAAAQAVSDNAEATEAQQTDAISALTKAMKACRDSRIPQSADVTVIANIKGNTAGETQKITVKATDAAAYGYTKPEDMESEVTVLDALADLHAAMYGDAFKAAPENYLEVNAIGWITKIFENVNGNVGFLVNNKMPGNATSNAAVLNSGDVVNVFVYNESVNYSDAYLYFDTVASDIMARKAFTLNVQGYEKVSWGGDATAQKNIAVVLRDSQGNTVVTGTTDENGNVTLYAAKEGTYTAVITGAPYQYYIPVNAQVVVKAHKHSFTKWTKVSDATVFAPEKQTSTCDLCGEKTTQPVGKKLDATVKLSRTALTLKLRQSATVKATGLAKGDSVESWRSLNKSVATVDKNGKITATSKEGKATIEVTLASGKTATVAVTVKMIRTKNVTKVPKTITLTTGKKYTLKPVVTPSDSQEKVVYWSGNKKIATVSSKGVITAVKPGKVNIAVKSGKHKVLVTVTVKAPAPKAIKNVPANKTVAKGKSFTLKPQLSPAGSAAKITYVSGDKKIATVDAKGKVTGKKKGTAVITVKAGKLTVKCKVTVK